MKKLFLILFAIGCVVTAAMAYNPLSSSDIGDGKIYCHYLDGSVIVINGAGVCPMEN